MSSCSSNNAVVLLPGLCGAPRAKSRSFSGPFPPMIRRSINPGASISSGRRDYLPISPSPALAPSLAHVLACAQQHINIRSSITGLVQPATPNRPQTDISSSSLSSNTPSAPLTHKHTLRCEDEPRRLLVNQDGQKRPSLNRAGIFLN